MCPWSVLSFGHYSIIIHPFNMYIFAASCTYRNMQVYYKATNIFQESHLFSDINLTYPIERLNALKLAAS